MAYRNKAQNGFFMRNRQLGAAIDARVNSLTDKLIIDHIWDQTLSQAGSPVWRHFSDEVLVAVARGVTRQAVHNAIDRMMSDEFRWISRRPAAHDGRAWEYRVHTENFERGPVWAARECRPRADARAPDMQSGLGVTPTGQVADMPSAVDILSPAELASPTWHNLSADCTYACECPYLLKKYKNSLSSSSVVGPTTTGSAPDAVPPDAAPDCPTSPEQRIADDPPNGRDTVTGYKVAVESASVRPSDRTERKRAVPRPHQRPSKNGGDRPDGGSRRADLSVANEQNNPLLCAEIHCPPVVAEAVARVLGPADKPFLRDFWAKCREAAPDVTPDELVCFIGETSPVVRKGARSHPYGYLRTVVVTALSKLDDWRADRAKQPPPPPEFQVCGECGHEGFVWLNGNAGRLPEDQDVILAVRRGEARFCGSCVVGIALQSKEPLF